MLGKSLAATSVIVLALAAPALAQTPTQISQYNAWGAYSYQSKSGKVCYVLSVPTSKKPSNVDHGDNFFLVSQKPGQNVSYEPQFMAGYDLKDKVIAKVDNGTPFTLFTSGRSAWLENAAQEPQLISAMKAGGELEIDAESARGTKTNYTFSLKGISAALDAISKCK